MGMTNYVAIIPSAKSVDDGWTFIASNLLDT